MAAGLEYQVISKIIELQDFHSIQRLKITEDYFFSPECKSIFNYLWKCFHSNETFGSVPSFEICQRIFPGLLYSPSPDTLDMLCEQLRLQRMRVELLDIAEKVQQFADFNPREGMAALRTAAAELSTRHEVTNDLLLSSAYDVLLKDYELVAEGHGLTGLPWPWVPLNEATQGIHNGEFIVVYGRPKNMKTWLCLYVITLMNMYANTRVLVYSLEMAPKQMTRRIAAIRAVVNYKSLLSGTLQPHDKERFFSQLKQLSDEAHLHKTDPTASVKHAELMVTSGKGAGGISFLHSKIREFRPDIVLVDGMYLMQDDRQQKRTIDWKAIAHISQDLKRTATQFDIPVMATAQANRKADKNMKNADLSEIAYSDAIAQDTDFSIRVQKRIDGASKEPEIVLAFPGSREVDLDELLIHGIPALNFGLKSTVVVHNKDEDESKKKDSAPAHRAMPTIPAGRLRKSS
jgi:replicative DNA helicase